MIKLRGSLCNFFILLAATLSIYACEIKNEKRKARGVLEMSKTAPGIYQGTILEISARQRLAYLQTTDDQIMELTFKNDSVLTDNGKPLHLKKLRKGNKLQVTLSKVKDSLEVRDVIILR